MGRREQDFGNPDPTVSGIMEPVISVKATIHQELPTEVHEVLRKNNLKIKLEKVHAQRLIDQRPGMIASDGCISSPSGPRC